MTAPDHDAVRAHVAEGILDGEDIARVRALLDDYDRLLLDRDTWKMMVGVDVQALAESLDGVIDARDEFRADRDRLAARVEELEAACEHEKRWTTSLQDQLDKASVDRRELVKANERLRAELAEAQAAVENIANVWDDATWDNDKWVEIIDRAIVNASKIFTPPTKRSKLIGAWDSGRTDSSIRVKDVSRGDEEPDACTCPCNGECWDGEA